jgi:hypothetical protein
MADTVDYSLVCCVDSDLPGNPLEPDNAVQDAGSHRAQLGYNVSLAGGAFDTKSRRQHSTAVDTAAAECFAASSLGAVLVHITGVVRFLSFGVLGNEPVRMWCDNDAAVLAGSDASSIKRLAYIARRVRFLQELVVRGVVTLLSVPGTANPADMFTTSTLPKRSFVNIAHVCTIVRLLSSKSSARDGHTTTFGRWCCEGGGECATPHTIAGGGA